MQPVRNLHLNFLIVYQEHVTIWQRRIQKRCTRLSICFASTAHHLAYLSPMRSLVSTTRNTPTARLAKDSRSKDDSSLMNSCSGLPMRLHKPDGHKEEYRQPMEKLPFGNPRFRLAHPQRWSTIKPLANGDWYEP